MDSFKKQHVTQSANVSGVLGREAAKSCGCQPWANIRGRLNQALVNKDAGCSRSDCLQKNLYVTVNRQEGGETGAALPAASMLMVAHRHHRAAAAGPALPGTACHPCAHATLLPALRRQGKAEAGGARGSSRAAGGPARQ